MSSPTRITASYTAFVNTQWLASGSLRDTLSALITAHRQSAGQDNPVFWLFDDARGSTLELDFRGTPAEVEARITAQMPPPAADLEIPAARSGPGRPRLGVIAREVTLLPQHWDWLGKQPGGASVALRKLVHTASKAGALQDRARASLEAAHRVMLTLGGSLPGFEEATRAMFKGDFTHTKLGLQAWPADLQTYVSRLLDRAEQDAIAAAAPPAEA